MYTWLYLKWKTNKDLLYSTGSSMLCGSLDGKGVWGRMDTSVCVAQSLCCPPETNNIVNELATPQYKMKEKRKEQGPIATGAITSEWEKAHCIKVSLGFMCILMKGESESEVTQSYWLFATPWTVAHQAPLSMGFSRQEFWNSGLPFPSPGDLPDPEIEPWSPGL